MSITRMTSIGRPAKRRRGCGVEAALASTELPGVGPVASSVVSLTVREGSGQRDLDGAARVWAEATAARDEDPDVPPFAIARGVLLDSLARDGCMLLVAVEDDVVVGFATAEPIPPLTDRARRAQVRYLGVSPDRWGVGIGQRVMQSLVERLKAAGYQSAELAVYVDNAHAINLYEGSGWVLEPGQPVAHRRSGRLERRYRLDLRAG
jgi:ribosomal protein S18 acetylase RimI-like enzyme